MPARWLVKTEPSAYSFAHLVRDRRTVWDGVRNAAALEHLAAIRVGDRLLIYHTGTEKAVVGTAVADTPAYADPRGDDPKRLVVALRAGPALARPVPLARIKASPTLATWDLVRLPRLSVMPVSAAQWAEIERLSKA